MKHIARKRFGQNFLIDRAVIDAIVAAIDVHPGDTVVEIGPGLGALTKPMLVAVRKSAAAQLHVIELDRDLVKRLNAEYPPSSVTVHEADALQFDFAQLAQTPSTLRLIGNLPYNISSPLLFHLIGFIGQVKDQHFMLQKEVVERMTAAPGDSAFGRLSVMLQVHYQMDHLFDVEPSAFDPPPKVTSAIVRMVPDQRLASSLLDAALFSALVSAAFSQRRKMLRNTLANYQALVPMEHAGISPTARAEDISAAQYVDYANQLFNRSQLHTLGS